MAFSAKTKNELSTGPIADAVAPQKADAVERAKQDAAARFETVKKTFEAAGWDLNVAAPVRRPDWSTAYKDERARRDRLRYFVRHVASVSRPGDPAIVEWNENAAQRYLAEAIERTEMQYEAFVAKLVKKCGPGVVSATLEGNHVWGRSFLTVTKQDGSKECWMTQQILNYSVLGTPYNQWPSRKVK